MNHVFLCFIYINAHVIYQCAAMFLCLNFFLNTNMSQVMRKCILCYARTTGADCSESAPPDQDLCCLLSE